MPMSPAKISVDAIKELRERTSAPLGDCRKALEETGGDQAKALAWLRERGAAIAQKREGRTTGQGRVEAYLHHDGRIAALVEVGCETDFVARTPDFIQFCKDVAMQVAAMNPKALKIEEGAAVAPEDKAAYLFEQPFIKDSSQKIGDMLQGLIAKTGENVVIKRFTRFAVGESAGS